MKKPIPTIQVLLLFFILVGSSCRKKEVKREEVRFDFLIPITVLPIKDTVSVGEEITISTIFSDSVYDMNSAKRYYLPNFNWLPMIFITKMVAPQKYYSAQPSAGTMFDYINVDGGFTAVGNVGANMKYVYENNKYKLVVKIKPKATGVFSVLFNNDISAGQIKLPQEFAPSSSSVTRIPVIGNMRNLVNNGQTNYHILRQNCLVEGPEITGEIDIWLSKNSIYTFVVK